MNTKHFIREKILAERKLFSEYKFYSENESIVESVNSIIGTFKNHSFKHSVGLYLPLTGEPDLTKVILYNNLSFGLPKIYGDEIKFIHYQLGVKLEKTAKGFMQPLSNFDLAPGIIIVPGLAYSLQGYRLGFGSGHYDKYFAKNAINNSIVKIGVCFDKYLLEYLPYEKHDIRFDYIITDKMILKL